jgi:hypothetical protein
MELVTRVKSSQLTKILKITGCLPDTSDGRFCCPRSVEAAPSRCRQCRVHVMAGDQQPFPFVLYQRCALVITQRLHSVFLLLCFLNSFIFSASILFLAFYNLASFCLTLLPPGCIASSLSVSLFINMIG